MRELCVVQREGEVAGPRDPGTKSHSIKRCSPGTRIADLIRQSVDSKKFFVSVELMPGTSPHLQALLEQSLQEISHVNPLFVSVTWREEHLKILRLNNKVIEVQHPSIDLCKLLQNEFGIPALMHLSAGNLGLHEVHAILEACLAANLINIFAVRGDERDEKRVKIPHTSDLVHYIKKEFGSVFSVGVAGYPSVHPEAESQKEDLLHLKEKVDTGADYILTQMITSFEEIQDFSHLCADIGVTVPILPGLFHFQSYRLLAKLIKTCRIKVPHKILLELKQLNDERKEYEYGMHLLKKIFERVEQSSSFPGAHIFTMNSMSAVMKLTTKTK